MNKTNIYVSVRTPEECKRAYEILSRANEKIFKHYSDAVNEFVYLKYSVVDSMWFMSEYNYKLKEVTLDRLESMLCGKGETDPISLTNPDAYEIGKKEIDYERHLTLFGKEKADNVLWFWMQGYEFADQQTSSLRKENERLHQELDLRCQHVLAKDQLLQQKDEEIDRLKQCAKELYRGLDLMNDVYWPTGEAELGYAQEQCQNLSMELLQLNKEFETVNPERKQINKKVKSKINELEQSLTSYRELMGRMESKLIDYQAELFSNSAMIEANSIEDILTEHKKLEG